MTTLFDPVSALGVGGRPGYRLRRLELLNWGTFDGRVWSFEPTGANALLTGDIGSGKSTIVDGISTLLLPANRITYNRAAGATTRERDLRSYVLGYYKSERTESTGTSRPVGLRHATSSYSVILGVFVNEGYDAVVSLAGVFWNKDAGQGQPERFYAVADRDLSVEQDLANFGEDINALRRRLRKSGVEVYDHFPKYRKEFRRKLAIPSEQAVDLFHQTVSMKSVGDLNEFVRNHMLEPFDATTWTERLVQHFEDLVGAHDAVVRARAQLAALQPIVDDCDKYDELTAAITALNQTRSALRLYCVERKQELLRRQVEKAETAIEQLRSELGRLDGHVSELEERRRGLELERAGAGGDRLREIEEDLRRAEDDRDHRRGQHSIYGGLLDQAELGPVESATQFVSRREEIVRGLATADEGESRLQNEQNDIAIAKRDLDKEAEEVNRELVSLKERPSNVPYGSLQLRSRLCQELGIADESLPFAGELLRVATDQADWEGAAERVLHGFALSVLVSNDHYTAVSDWIETHHLGSRLVYYRVPATLGPDRGEPTAAAPLLADKLEIKDSPFSQWLYRELRRRAGYTCVESMHDFRRADFAVTMAGQVKGARGRHEKNDRHRIDDRRSYVLGWDNAAKVDALLEQAQQLQRDLAVLARRRRDVEAATKKASARRGALSQLSMFTEYAQIDWQASVHLIDDLTAQREAILTDSVQLADIDRRLAGVKAEQGRVADRQGQLQRQQGEQGNIVKAAREALDGLATAGSAEELESARAHYSAVDALVGDRPMDTTAAVDRFEREQRESLDKRIETHTSRRRAVESRLIRTMGDFRRVYPSLATEVDAAVESAGEFRELHARLRGDDLPRFEEEFKRYLNTNTIRDIANFQAALTKQTDLIRARVDTINESLVGIDYNPDRYITLEAKGTVNTEVRDFRSALRACTDNSFTGDAHEQYSEQKFLEVKAIIERFKGREGQVDADRAWTRRVTDVRNWFMFSASERWRSDDSEYEHYTDSGGKSGGQKEKLAYTILAASLAYQFKLDWGATRSKTFRFVVIDEAFGRGSDESTRFALQLFQRLGLQLVIVTPLQKIHVIEPFVSSVGFVDNPKGNYSRLLNMTIEEYRRRQLARALSRGAGADDRDAI